MAAGSFTLAVLTKNRTNPAYVGARMGADRVAGASGGKTVHLVPEKPDDVEEQIALVHEALAIDPSAILMCPAHPTRLGRAVAAIERASVPLFYFVSETDPSPAVTFVGSDNEALGHAVAHRMATHLGGRGAVAVVNGHPDSPTTTPRAAGFARALAEFPDIRVVSECQGDYQREVAYAAFRAELEKLEELGGVIVANDFMALGVLEALAQAGREVPVVGVNATPQGIELIEQGRMIASAAFDAMSMGAIAAEAAVRTLRGERVPRRIDLPVQLVDSSNLAAWNRDYAERTTLPWETAVAGHTGT